MMITGWIQEPVAKGVLEGRTTAPEAVDRELQATFAGMTQALDTLGHGVVLLENDTTLVFCNAAARAIFSDASTWLVQGDQLGCQRTGVRDEWKRALHAARTKHVRVLVEFPGRSGPVHAAVIPMGVENARVFVVLGKIEICGVLEQRMFAARCGLTATETDVLHLLCQGLAPSEIAQAHGVAVSTVTSQITAIRSKSGVSSIRALLHAVSRLPPLRPAVATN